MNEEKSLVLSETLVNDLIPNTSLSQESLAKICNRLPELHRAKTAVGRKNSQTTATLMTMTMLADSPYRQMKQCLSQINNKRNALIEVHFNTQKSKVKIKKWEESGTEMDFSFRSSFSFIFGVSDVCRMCLMCAHTWECAI